MKRKIVAALILLCISVSACGNETENKGSEHAVKQESEEKEDSGKKEEIKEDSEEEKKEEKDEGKTYSTGETWTVDGQWTLTVNSISLTDQRNEFEEKNPAQVFIIDYTYENLGYEDKDGIMNGLFFDLSMGQIVDSTGLMGYSYPGDVTNYAQEVPVGAKCQAQACIGVENESTELKITISQYDGTGTEQKATFALPIN